MSRQSFKFKVSGLIELIIMEKIKQLGLVDTLRIIENEPRFKKLLKNIDDGNQSIVVGAAARAFMVAALIKSRVRPFFIVAPSFDRARRIAVDLRAFGVEAELLPDIETMPYDSLSPGAHSVGKRFMLLDEMQSGLEKVWVTPVQSILRILPSPVEGLHKSLRLEVGDEIDLHTFAEKLVDYGYARNTLVDDHGQFSLRGGIIDIFPSNSDYPVRIEFFGDEVESIRSFNVSSQRSTAKLKKVSIYRCRQLHLSADRVSKIDGILSDLAVYGHISEQSELLENEVSKLKDLHYFEGVDKFMPFIYEDGATVIDYLPRKTVMIFDEPEEISQLADSYYAQQEQYVGHLVEHKAILKPPRPYYAEPGILNDKRFHHLNLISIGESVFSGETDVEKTDAIKADTATTGAKKGLTKKEDRMEFKAAPVPSMAGKISELPDILKGIGKKGLIAVLTLSDKVQLERVDELLGKAKVRTSTNPKLKQGTVFLTTGGLSTGFESADLGLAIITASDLFGKQIPKKKQRPVGKGNAITSLSELALGDYVVHSTHGIAVYAGLQQREIAGVTRDYALLEYAGTDRLFVPVDQLDRLTKYIGASGETPTVTRLGGADWLKAKRKAQASVKKIAYDLLSLYALRANSKGFAYSADTPWQVDLEESFRHDETPDQLYAIQEVKRDMESGKPMDRLICGDVGYGKTEVAVRAAFKAAADGKQVMVLVPTTILAQQHGKTFSERLAPFPVTVEMISRFKTPSQQKEIVDRFNKGRIDILIGTHRLLAKDVQPFDLGLVIVDEEQRFGVNDKEKLRNFKKSVDVLTLSATPIPRTLQMSLAGVRDMSTIETPPEGRHPIVTHVGRYDEEMIVEAIRREVGRGGQVYFVHNRVESIDAVAQRLEKLVPGLKVGVGHGQMSEHVLERIMLAFLEKRYDVLVCTTIIESGIDIPTVNTLIVDRAELLGLSQLYQLRGRVGRTDKRAYSYFFYSPQQSMTNQAFERLKTISDYTELGSGIKIALRDLEIRGAGNLLGAEQHGYMSSIGFELYCQLLKEAIDELEGNRQPDPIEIKIDLPVDAFIPDEYISQESLRIDIYKKIVLIKEIADIDQVNNELKDRFGAVPVQVKRLLDIAKLRWLARRLGVTEIVYQNNRIKISPLQLTRSQALAIAKQIKSVTMRQERRSLSIMCSANDEMVAFLNDVLSDIIVAPHPEVNGSQKER
jgi:transcription-repair coupling factor (superfamily II helicase)